MPRFVIERQYLMTVCQRLVIEAPTLDAACQQAVEYVGWEDAEEDAEESGMTTINAIKEIPDGVPYDVTAGTIDDGLGLSEFLWKDLPGFGERIPVPFDYESPVDF